MFDDLILKIRRRETPLYDRLFRLYKVLRGFEMPVIPGLYRFLYFERSARIASWRNLVRIFYYTPMFRSRCDRVGKRLYLTGGIPLILGHLRLIIGDDVTLYGYSTLTGAKVFEAPTLTVGDHTYLGYQLTISVGCDVTVGCNVMVGDRVNIMSYDGHPSNPKERYLPAPVESSRPIIIEDNVWIGPGSVILKGVTIGEGSVVVAGSVVTARVPKNCLVVGNPARVYPLMLP